MNDKFINNNKNQIINIIRTALSEDIKTGDITTNSIISKELTYVGQFIVKESGIVGGLQVAKLVFKELDKSLQFKSLVNEGDYVPNATIIAKVNGSAQSILSAERTALNFLQRISGIATETNKYVKLTSHTKCKILDTRKTMPGLRLLDKWSVRLGGGKNHRMGLYDMVLIKDNHIEAAGGVSNAFKKIKNNIRKNILIEIEVKTIQQLKEILQFKPDRIMLDNMTIDEIVESVKIVNEKIPLEASGNINLNNVQAIAETGVDYISVGKITHSVKSLDISLSFTKQR